MELADIGLIGLGTMGAMLALNIAERGHRIAVWNRTTQVTRDFAAGAGDLSPRIVPTESLAALVAALKPPRAIILMVPAGPIVDDEIAALRPLMGPDDLIIDAGNANFHDTDRRSAEAKIKGSKSYDIGLQLTEAGTYKLVADWWGIEEETNQTQEQITQKIVVRYAYHKVKNEVTKQGFTLDEEQVEPDGTIKLGVSKW